MTSTRTRQPNWRQRFAILIGLVISAVFLYGAFRGLQPDAFFESLADVDVLWVLTGAITYGLAVVVIALRWQFLLRSVRHIALLPLTQIVAIGYMGNNVYPLRAGEALRVFLLKRRHEVPLAQAATTVVVERAFDGLVMLSFILIGVLAAEITADEIQRVASIAAPIFGVALLAFFVLAARPQWLRAVVNLFIRPLPDTLGDRVAGLAEDVISGLEGLRSPAYLAGTIVCSYLTWAIEAVVYWQVMWAFGFDQPYAIALLVVGTVNLAGLIPASPGQIGVYEFFASAVMIAAGIASAEALAYAIVVHLVIWLPVTLAGFIFLARMGLGWQTIRTARQLNVPADAPNL